MTYREMLDNLLQATEDELGQDITVHCKEQDEFFSVTQVRVAGADGEACPASGILDNGHLYLEIV